MMNPGWVISEQKSSEKALKKFGIKEYRFHFFLRVYHTKKLPVGKEVRPTFQRRSSSFLSGALLPEF